MQYLVCLGWKLEWARFRKDSIECLVQSLGGSGISGCLVELARRLEAVNLNCSTDPAEALSWLDCMEKILDEGMECPVKIKFG